MKARLPGWLGLLCVDVAAAEIEVLSHAGGYKLSLRTAGGTFDAQLDWSARQAPVVTRIDRGGA
jgi:hypothetical protein